MRHSRITDLVWCGGEIGPREWAALWEQGVRVVLSLQEEARDDFGSLTPEAELWLPTRDWHMPSLAQLRLATRFIAAAVEACRPIVVHCKYGIGRAPMTVACYLITCGMGVSEAIDYVRTRRPIVDPNHGQITVVKEFARSLSPAGLSSPSGGVL